MKFGWLFRKRKTILLDKPIDSPYAFEGERPYPFSVFNVGDKQFEFEGILEAKGHLCSHVTLNFPIKEDREITGVFVRSPQGSCGMLTFQIRFVRPQDREIEYILPPGHDIRELIVDGQDILYSLAESNLTRQGLLVLDLENLDIYSHRVWLIIGTKKKEETVG